MVTQMEVNCFVVMKQIKKDEQCSSYLTEDMSKTQISIC
jgi:hypothetical protein